MNNINGITNEKQFVSRVDVDDKVGFPFYEEAFMGLIQELARGKIVTIGKYGRSYQLKDKLLIESTPLDNNGRPYTLIANLGNKALKDLINDGMYLVSDYFSTYPNDTIEDNTYCQYIQYVLKTLKEEFYNNYDKNEYETHYGDRTLSDNEGSDDLEYAKFNYRRDFLIKIVEEIFKQDGKIKSYQDFLENSKKQESR